MSEEATVDQMESRDNVNSNIIRYSTIIVERTIERALDVIYEQANHMDPQIHEWRHSVDAINILKN